MAKFIYDIETLGLNPLENRIVSIAIKNVETGSVYCFCDENEKYMLELFFLSIASATELIGFNSDMFDLPYLVKRAFINNAKVACNLKKIKSIDLRKIVNSYNLNPSDPEYKYNKGSLSYYAKLMNIEIKTEAGNMMPTYWQNKEYQKIKEHNQEDVMVTEAFYKRLVEMNLL